MRLSVSFVLTLPVLNTLTSNMSVPLQKVMFNNCNIQTVQSCGDEDGCSIPLFIVFRMFRTHELLNDARFTWQ